MSVDGADLSGSAPATVSRRLLIALGGAVLCALGVLAASTWLIGAGIASLVASSLVPDKAVALPGSVAESVRAGRAGWLGWAAAGVTLVLVAVGGLFRRGEAGWPLAVWLIGLAVLVGAVLQRDVATGALSLGPPSWRSFDLWMVAALTFVGFALRLYRLETLPPMHGDEGEMGMRALRVGADEAPLAPFVTDFFDHATLFHFLQRLAMGVFGQSVFGLRMGSALFGALCIPLMYATGRLGWSRRVGIVAAAVLAFSHIHIHLSRMALNNIHTVFGAVAMAACLLWAYRTLTDRTGALTPLLLAGLACGLSQYLYHGSRLLPIVLVPAIVVFLWRFQTQTARVLVIPFGFVLGWLPMLPWYAKVPGAFASRQRGVSVFNEVNRAAVDADSTWGVLVHQFERNLRFFIDAGDVSTFYFLGAPGLNVVAAVLFWIGLGLTLARMKSFPNFFIVSWFALGLVLGGVLTSGAPAATRLVVIFPAVALFAGIAVDYFLGLAGKPPERTEPVQSAVLVGLAVVLALFGADTYFGRYADDPPRAAVDTIGRAFVAESDEADTFLLGAPLLFAEHGTLRFTSHPDPPRNLLDAADLAAQENRKPQLFVVAMPQQEEALVQLSQDVPGGNLETVVGVNGEPVFFTYLVDH